MLIGSPEVSPILLPPEERSSHRPHCFLVGRVIDDQRTLRVEDEPASLLIISISCRDRAYACRCAIARFARPWAPCSTRVRLTTSANARPGPDRRRSRQISTAAGGPQQDLREGAVRESPEPDADKTSHVACLISRRCSQPEVFSENRAEGSSQTRLGRCTDPRGRNLDGQSRSLVGRERAWPVHFVSDDGALDLARTACRICSAAIGSRLLVTAHMPVLLHRK